MNLAFIFTWISSYWIGQATLITLSNKLSSWHVSISLSPEVCLKLRLHFSMLIDQQQERKLTLNCFNLKVNPKMNILIILSMKLIVSHRTCCLQLSSKNKLFSRRKMIFSCFWPFEMIRWTQLLRPIWALQFQVNNQLEYCLFPFYFKSLAWLNA